MGAGLSVTRTSDRLAGQPCGVQAKRGASSRGTLQTATVRASTRARRLGMAASFPLGVAGLCPAPGARWPAATQAQARASTRGPCVCGWAECPQPALCADAPWDHPRSPHRHSEFVFLVGFSLRVSATGLLALAKKTT